jgi:hypothetical protein
MASHSISAQLEEVVQEIKRREREYPGDVTRGRLRASEADFKIDRLRGVKSTLEWLPENEATIRAKIEWKRGGRTLEERTDTIIVKSETGRALAYLYFEDDPTRRQAMQRMSRAEAMALAEEIAGGQR